ncbi:hypothetical protein C8R46DRAFT_1027629 [Mycena filopes]|nr:hypothetical protein C8R46DRAFT_1027629 [Mycena filopes]
MQLQGGELTTRRGAGSPLEKLEADQRWRKLEPRRRMVWDTRQGQSFSATTHKISAKLSAGRQMAVLSDIEMERSPLCKVTAYTIVLRITGGDGGSTLQNATSTEQMNETSSRIWIYCAVARLWRGGGDEGRGFPRFVYAPRASERAQQRTTTDIQTKPGKLMSGVDAVRWGHMCSGPRYVLRESKLITEGGEGGNDVPWTPEDSGEDGASEDDSQGLQSTRFAAVVNWRQLE